jgi:hypothetical protein
MEYTPPITCPSRREDAPDRRWQSTVQVCATVGTLRYAASRDDGPER